MCSLRIFNAMNRSIPDLSLGPGSIVISVELLPGDPEKNGPIKKGLCLGSNKPTCSFFFDSTDTTGRGYTLMYYRTCYGH